MGFCFQLLQITIFDADSEESQDLDLAILTALLKGECLNKVILVLPSLFPHSWHFVLFMLIL